ncbi:hypothetical protein AYO20_05715 [Fonsecaea nubica]|uniref:Small ribosomal subunit protein mS33 n=1 Tax=Fonsecaea nubica TaxID=856822 RepID=A0A178CYQ2_9EURO|nr:hypothetical protein AYO20_05715 [Fonsecaea nubica]OAL35000.1 hypothetical protein AYO20_05715 [Fonsecaea nubica]
MQQRLGNKVLRQRLKGPALASYYPRRSATVEDVLDEFKKFDLEGFNEEEDDRLENVAFAKLRGKGAPKKKKSAAGMVFKIAGSQQEANICCRGTRQQEEEITLAEHSPVLLYINTEIPNMDLIHVRFLTVLPFLAWLVSIAFKSMLRYSTFLAVLQNPVYSPGGNICRPPAKGNPARNQLRLELIRSTGDRSRHSRDWTSRSAEPVATMTGDLQPYLALLEIVCTQFREDGVLPGIPVLESETKPGQRQPLFARKRFRDPISACTSMLLPRKVLPHSLSHGQRYPSVASCLLVKHHGPQNFSHSLDDCGA